MNLKDMGACRAIASKIKEIKNGNRLMAQNDVNLTVTLHRRDEPETKCGVVKINGSFGFSLFDAAVRLLAAIAVLRVLRIFRR